MKNAVLWCIRSDYASVASILEDLTILNSCNRFYTTFCCWSDTSIILCV